MMQDKDIMTGDEGTSAEMKSIMSEINTADTQLNTSCTTKQSETHHCSTSNATAEPFDRLCLPSITLFEDRERRTVRVNDRNGRTSAIVGSVSVITIRSPAPEQYHDPDGTTEVACVKQVGSLFVVKGSAGARQKVKGLIYKIG